MSTQLFEENLMGLINNTTFNDAYQSVIPFIDPDSTRFVEWLGAYRNKLGMQTYVTEFLMPPDINVNMDELVEMISDRVEAPYQSPMYFRAFRMNKELDVPDLFITIGCDDRSTRFSIVAVGLKEEASAIHELFAKKYIPIETIKVRQLSGFSADGSTTINEHDIKKSDVVLATDAFYPNMENSIDDTIKNFKASKANVLLLIGSPGTGKSTWLRTVLFKMQAKHNYITYTEAAIMNPSFVTWLETLGDDALLIIEDADNFALKREDKNYQMSALLNFADGIIAKKCKIIISTNLASTQKVDEALLRVGRNFGILEFSHLSPEEANEARESIGLEAIDFEEDQKALTLSEALNFEHIREEDEKNRKVKFGFTA